MILSVKADICVTIQQRPICCVISSLICRQHTSQASPLHLGRCWRVTFLELP